jgi:hypothetical protein
MKADLLWAIIFGVMFLVVIFLGRKEFKNSNGELTEELYTQKLNKFKSKQKKLYTKYDSKIKTLERDHMAKENVQFNAFAQANDRMKMLIESFCENFEVDMHEFEKNLFCIAYERGYADGQYDLKKSLKDEE